MPFTRNINYTQNIPVSMGFDPAHFTPTPSRDVSFTFGVGYGNVGNVDFDSDVIAAHPDVVITRGLNGINSSWDGVITLTGPVAGVNALLASATWTNRFYEIEDVVQDTLSQNRNLDNCHGELCVMLPASTDTAHLGVGSTVYFNTVNDGATGTDSVRSRYQFLVTRLDTSVNAVRVWAVLFREYPILDNYHASMYRNVFSTATTGNPCWIQRSIGSGRQNIAPVIDASYMNTSGYLSFETSSVDGVTTDSGTFTMIGEFLIDEPVWVAETAGVVTTGTNDGWFLLDGMGSISQTEDNFQHAQYLIKALHNDPMYLDVSAYTSLPGYPTTGTEDQKDEFVGALIDARASLGIPKYITDNTYGAFSDVQVGERASTSYLTGGVVRWAFYGTPDQCNQALAQSRYYRPRGFTKDFKIEVRIVNDRTRIYSGRGN